MWNGYYGVGGGGGALVWRNRIPATSPLRIVVGAGGISGNVTKGGASSLAVVGGSVYLNVSGGSEGFGGKVLVLSSFVAGVSGGGNGGDTAQPNPILCCYSGGDLVGGGGAGGYYGGFAFR